MTSAWWLDATPQACWHLIADAQGWPRWWRSLRDVGAAQGPEAAIWAPPWRALCGLRLRLRLRQRASTPCQLIEWQVYGDIRARLTWVIDSAPPGGCDVTCRWELERMTPGSAWLRTLTRLLVERSHFDRMRACARDMASALGCKGARLREWSGQTHR